MRVGVAAVVVWLRTGNGGLGDMFSGYSVWTRGGKKWSGRGLTA